MLSPLPTSLLLALLQFPSSYAAVQVNVPATPSGSNVVDANFLGISFELSFTPDYFGSDSTHINIPMLNYLAGIRVRTGADSPVRIRIGGNSADISAYSSEAASPMVQLIDGDFNFDDQPVNYNSMLWSVLSAVSTSIGGAAYLVNVPLAIPPNASLSADIRNILGSDLESMLLGNEPDLYTGHGKRPSLKNYTVADYLADYTSAINMIGSDDAEGHQDIAGPSDLASLLQEGYLGKFSSDLKYISLQHYPQNNCDPGNFAHQLPWYMQHANVVLSLSTFQKDGIDYLLQQPAANRPQLINSEFNSASCGGVPFSPSFGVGSLWSIDYSLQMASLGYTQAYIHTREAGISYNLLAPPALGTSGAWTTNSPYYAVIAVAEALRTDNGGIVQDLDLEGSSTNVNATTAGYAVYNAGNHTVSRLVLFNYANSSTEFALPKTIFSTSGTAVVKFLAAATAEEETNISWGGQTWGPGVSDGKSTLSPSWVVPNQNLTGCAANGCIFAAPGPSLAMVFLDGAQFEVIQVPNPSNPNTDANNGNNNGSNTGSKSGNTDGNSTTSSGTSASGTSSAVSVRVGHWVIGLSALFGRIFL